MFIHILQLLLFLLALVILILYVFLKLYKTPTNLIILYFPFKIL